MPDITTMLQALKQGETIIPEELMKKFEYCTSNASKYVIENFIVEENLTPERKYRSVLLQLYSKMQALMDLYYNESKRERDIRRKEIEIIQLERRKEQHAGHMYPEGLELIELDIQDKREEIAKIHDERKLTKPLLDDAQKEVQIYLDKLAELEGQIGDFEAAEETYFDKKLEHDLKVEVLAQKTGLSKPVVEQLYRRSPEKFEQYLPESLHDLLPAPRQVEHLMVPKRKIALLIIGENLDNQYMVNVAKLNAPEGFEVEGYFIGMEEKLFNTRLKALEYAASIEADYFALIDAGLLPEEDALVKMHQAFEGDQVKMVQVDVPMKYSGERSPDNTAFCMFPATAKAEVAKALHDREYIKTPYPSWPAGLQAVLVNPEIARFDLSTGLYWSTPGFKHELLTVTA